MAFFCVFFRPKTKGAHNTFVIIILAEERLPHLLLVVGGGN